MNNNQAKKAVIGPVRFSYLHVFEPWAGSDGKNDPKYSACIIIPKSDKDSIDKIKAAIAVTYKDGASVFGGALPEKGKWNNPLRDGDLERPADEAFKDAYFINASSKSKPGIVKINPAGNPRYIPITNQDELYSGCYGYVSLGFFAYSNAGNKGVSAGLNNILKTSDGEYMGGRSSADTDFEGLELDGALGSAGTIDDNDIF